MLTYMQQKSFQWTTPTLPDKPEEKTKDLAAAEHYQCNFFWTFVTILVVVYIF